MSWANARDGTDPSPSAKEASILLDNARRARLVRLILLGSAVLAAGFLYWAVVSEDRGMSALLAVLGLLPLAGMLSYASIYLERIELRSGRLILTTASLTGSRICDVDSGAIQTVRMHDWAIEPGSSVSTPFLTLRIAGRRRPFLIDLAADHVDRPAIEALGRSRPR